MNIFRLQNFVSLQKEREEKKQFHWTIFFYQLWLLTKRKHGYVVSRKKWKKKYNLIECKWLKYAMMTVINASTSNATESLKAEQLA